jgi:hypothetical protein
LLKRKKRKEKKKKIISPQKENKKIFLFEKREINNSAKLKKYFNFARR